MFRKKPRISFEEYSNLLNKVDALSHAIEGMRNELDGLQAAEYYKKHRNVIPIDKDPLIDAAIKIALDYDKVSSALLQRRLKIGYARAARLLDLLEQKGIIGPADGSKPRDVLRRT